MRGERLVGKQHEVQSEDDLWAKATALSERGERGMLAHLLDIGGGTQLQKVFKATSAKETLRRKQLTREELLEEHLQSKTCGCATPGLCNDLMKELLQKNGVDGTFQATVLVALRVGRAKMRAVCLVGGP